MRKIYLDYASTTPTDPLVVQAMAPFFFENFGNASSPHQFGRGARKAIEDAREHLAAFIGATPHDIVFTSGASESNNQAILATARAYKNRGRHIITTSIEHHSVLEAVQQLEHEGFKVQYIQPHTDGVVNAHDIAAAITKETILICVHHANNEIGTIQPVEEIGRLCRQKNILFLVDATQTIGHIPFNVDRIKCDFCSLSAHKFYGPQGIGALYVRSGLELLPLIFGGDQERGRRAGTQNVPGIVGLGEAIQLCKTQMHESEGRETKLREHIIKDVLKHIPRVVLNGSHKDRLPNNAHFSFENINGEELVSALDMVGIGVSMGSACTWGRLQSSHVLKAIGLTEHLAMGSLRVTVGRWTTTEDVDYFLEQLKAKVSQLRG